MKTGIAGFKQSGKTTVFNALTGLSQETGYGASNKVNLGVIKVPDSRVDALAEIDQPKKTTYAEIMFADVPGQEGERCIEPRTQGQLREMDALALVVRGFNNGVSDPRPLEEVRDFESELILADIAVVEKRIERLKKDHSSPKELELLSRCYEQLEQGVPFYRIPLTEEEKSSLSGFAFLSLKPSIIVLNHDDSNESAIFRQDLEKYAGERGLGIVGFNGSIEMEIASLPESEQAEFLIEMGIEQSARDRFIIESFRLLDLICFFTRGSDECRAWPLRNGSTAVDAAGTVHSDMARGFIRADIIRIEDYFEVPSEGELRKKGRIRSEGRAYIVQDGDLCNFKFNV